MKCGYISGECNEIENKSVMNELIWIVKMCVCVIIK